MSGGGILSRRTGTLSSDGKLLFCPCGKQLHIHSAVTGERVGSISGHAAEVTGVLLNPDSDDQASYDRLRCHQGSLVTACGGARDRPFLPFSSDTARNWHLWSILGRRKEVQHSTYRWKQCATLPKGYLPCAHLGPVLVVAPPVPTTKGPWRASTYKITAVTIQVYTCSMDGTFRLWDFRSGEELQKVTAAAPIKHMVGS